MNNFKGYHCSICGEEYLPDEVTYTCPKDHGNLDIVLDNHRILETVTPDNIFSSNEHSLWRYLPLLPVQIPGASNTPLHSAGWTPVYAVAGLAQSLGLNSLWVKDESRNPTASFKDRASAVVIARARET